MKREVEYHEVTLSFAIRAREAQRVTRCVKTSDVRSSLAELLYSAIATRFDAENVNVAIDGKPEIRNS